MGKPIETGWVGALVAIGPVVAIDPAGVDAAEGTFVTAAVGGPWVSEGLPIGDAAG